MSETELQVQPKRRGRPKTVNITDKKEYQKKYYDNNRDKLLEKKKEYYSENKEQILECQKEYTEKLKFNDPEKYKIIREKQSEAGNITHKKALCIYKIIKELTKSGALTLPESHKDIILELIN